MPYTPEQALRAFLKASKSQPKPKVRRTLGEIAKETLGAAPVEQEPDAPKVPICCFPLAAFTNSDPAMPDDFHNVPKSGAGLKAHTRPDGAVFVGVFQLPKSPESCVVVFGPKDLPLDVAGEASKQYRKERAEQELRWLDEGRKQAHQPSTSTSSVS